MARVNIVKKIKGSDGQWVLRSIPFFIVPIVFSIVILLCLAAAAWLSGSQAYPSEIPDE